MLKIAKTAAVILAAMSPILAIAQKSQGRLDRKSSPSSSATSAPGAQGGTPVAPPSSQQFVTSENFFRANSKSNVSPNDSQATPQEPIVHPAPAVQTSPVMSPAVAVTSETAAVPMPAAQPVLDPSPPTEATTTVLYGHGQLTVISQNASLGTLLKLISSKTGAVIDLSPELQNEPVIAQIGPSPVREVLTGLLDSPKIDYIIMGDADTAGGVQRIVVRTRESFARTALAAGRTSLPRPQDANTETKITENGHPAAATATPQAPLTQEQLMENWKKIREEKRLAEIEQQRQDRENEQNQVQVEPQPQPEPQPDNPPSSENPPLK
jgi:hypothetical protein